jgi:hypothetical protein
MFLIINVLTINVCRHTIVSLRRLLTISVPWFQALHKIALRENVSTIRVCDVILQLMSTLIDLGLLAKKTASTSTATATSNLPSNKDSGQSETK